MSPHQPGSRAISIPVQPNSLRAATSRRNRSKGLERTDSSDAGRSSSSVSSSHSSWASSSAANPAGMPTKAQQKAPVRIPVNDRQEDSSHRTSNINTVNRTSKHNQPSTPSTSPPTRVPTTTTPHIHDSPLGPSMIASSSYKSINLSSGHEDDEPPRLICYTKHSQGFTWNDELFLPGYLLGRYGGSHRRRGNRWGDDDDGDEDMDGMMDSNDPERCPVAEIFVTDEEAENMMP